jgi:hypothetical protein
LGGDPRCREGKAVQDERWHAADFTDTRDKNGCRWQPNCLQIQNNPTAQAGAAASARSLFVEEVAIRVAGKGSGKHVGVPSAHFLGQYMGRV